MRKVICSKCDSEMKRKFQGNYDKGEWKGGGRRWTKIKKPMVYRMEFSCGKGTCKSQLTIDGRSKSQVIAGLNRRALRMRREKDVHSADSGANDAN